MKVRWNPSQQRFPALFGKLMVDTYRGQLRVRSWPRKRGKPQSETTRAQNAWFKGANELAKSAEPIQQNLAIKMTNGTGLYPRDLLIHQMSGGIYDIIDEDGIQLQRARLFREKVVFQGVFSLQTSTIFFAAGASVFPNWPLPIRDTAGFWNAGDPDRFTIPDGINIVQLIASIGVSPEATGLDVTIFNQSGVKVADALGQGFNINTETAVSAPLIVSSGDWFNVRGVCEESRTMTLNVPNAFALIVLDAD